MHKTFLIKLTRYLQNFKQSSFLIDMILHKTDFKRCDKNKKNLRLYKFLHEIF